MPGRTPDCLNQSQAPVLVKLPPPPADPTDPNVRPRLRIIVVVHCSYSNRNWGSERGKQVTEAHLARTPVPSYC